MMRPGVLMALALAGLCTGMVWAQDPAPAAAPAAAAPAEAAPAEAAPAEAAPAEAAPAPEAVPAVELPLTPIKQVQIQVWISQTDADGQRDIGTNLNYTRFTRAGQTHPGIEHSGSLERAVTDTFNVQDRRFDAVLPEPDPGPYPENLRQTDDSITIWTPTRGQIRKGAGLTFEILDGGNGTLEGYFRGMDTRTDTDLISKPELVVADQAQATVRAGEEIPYQSRRLSNNIASLQIDWQMIGVEMDLTPTIVSDDLIQLLITKLDVIDQLQPRVIGNLQIPVFSTRSQTGVVMVPNAQTLVIGGLSSRMTKRTERRVPIVGAIPLVGMLFRGRESRALNSELLIFVSPTIIDLREYTDRMDTAINFWREDRWKHMDKIQEEIDIMPYEL